MSTHNWKINYERNIREILIDLAHQRKNITYDKLFKISGIGDNIYINEKMNFLFSILNSILKNEFSKRRPCLTIIVFLSNKDEPSNKFYEIAEKVGVKDINIDNKTFFIDEIEKVYSAWENMKYYNYFRNNDV